MSDERPIVDVALDDRRALTDFRGHRAPPPPIEDAWIARPDAPGVFVCT